jgi:hypothetical protein
LLQQGVFHRAGVAVQQGRGLGAEVVQHLEALVAQG